MHVNESAVLPIQLMKKVALSRTQFYGLIFFRRKKKSLPVFSINGKHAQVIQAILHYSGGNHEHRQNILKSDDQESSFFVMSSVHTLHGRIGF